MAKLTYLLALAQAALVYGAPMRDVERRAKGLGGREITISSGLAITTSYTSAALSSLQSATEIVSPSITAVSHDASPIYK